MTLIGTVVRSVNFAVNGSVKMTAVQSVGAGGRCRQDAPGVNVGVRG